MHPISLRATLLAAALFTGLAAPAPLAAQDAEPAATTNVAPTRVTNGTRFGQWQVSCEALAVNETACVLTQRLARSTDGAFLAEMMAFSSADGSRLFLGARVPNGVYLPNGFALRPAAADDAAETRFVWQSCSRDLCEAVVELSAEELAAFEDAEGGLIAGFRPNLLAEPLIFSLSVGGASAGLAALAGAPAEE